MNLITIPLAAVAVVGTVASLVMLRPSTRIATGLVGMLGSLTVHTVLNVTALEMALGSYVPAASSLVKDVSLILVLLGIAQVLEGLGALKVKLAWLLTPVFLVIWKVQGWLQARSVCAGAMNGNGYIFDFCGLRVGSYAASEAAVVLVLAVAFIVGMMALRPMASWRSAAGRSVFLLMIAAGTIVLWLVAVALGIGQIFQEGALAHWQYTVRPTTSVFAVVVTLIAVLYLPVAKIVDMVMFPRRITPLLELLAEKGPAPALSTGHPATVVMDHIGMALDDDSVIVRNSTCLGDARTTAQWLQGDGPAPSGIPRQEALWVQREWLLQVAKVLKNDPTKINH